MARTFKCLIGRHNVPENLALEYCGAVFVGGICPDCGDIKQGKFLQNVWTEKIVHDDGWIELKGFDISFATKMGYVVIPLLAQEMWFEEGRSVLSGKPA